MNITDYADILNIEIEVTYYHNQNKRWSASFKGAELQDDGLLIGTYGNGATPREAIENYLEEVRGRILVFNASGSNRKEYEVPDNLTAS